MTEFAVMLSADVGVYTTLLIEAKDSDDAIKQALAKAPNVPHREWDISWCHGEPHDIEAIDIEVLAGPTNLEKLVGPDLAHIHKEWLEG